MKRVLKLILLHFIPTLNQTALLNVYKANLIQNKTLSLLLFFSSIWMIVMGELVNKRTPRITVLIKILLKTIGTILFLL